MDYLSFPPTFLIFLPTFISNSLHSSTSCLSSHLPFQLPGGVEDRAGERGNGEGKRGEERGEGRKGEVKRGKGEWGGEKGKGGRGTIEGKRWN
jgi:hypothetical protein